MNSYANVLILKLTHSKYHMLLNENTAWHKFSNNVTLYFLSLIFRFTNQFQFEHYFSRLGSKVSY
ncbi:hypothetical protein MADA3029_420022 [Vibrio nigripulchritudo MADA3029]|nr:hypothetical protein VIBNIMADA3020_160022 [Vibrio nigripulchritudo MADA3020]CCN54665.1 hypothetical protein VIBNIMADA3021_560154 [Vibrio nigripulchritudo MADA3021]CCN59417.1 hypothetical protein MADA3029_420022 [Vibrio nigripulchritudo MADA3029]